MSAILNTRRAISSHLIWVFLVVGLFLPTSRGGVTSNAYGFAAVGLMVLLCFLLLDFRADRLVPIFAIFGLLCLFTLTSYIFGGLHDIRMGAAVNFVGLGVMLSLDLKNVTLTAFSRRLFWLISVAMLAFVGLILAGNETVRDLLVAYYSYFYQTLVRAMLVLRKPVLFFASHSIAALGMYLFFYLNLRAGRRFIAFCFILACFALTSFSGFAMGLIALTIWTTVQLRRHPVVTVAAASVVLIVGVKLILVYWDEISTASEAYISFTASGPLSRYGASGNLRPALEYIADNPWFPIGLTHHGSMMVGDSGPVEYLLRGSVLLMVLIYGAFASFLYFNLKHKIDFVVLLGSFLLFDQGYTSLSYFRFYYLLPFAVVYLNAITPAPEFEVPAGWRRRVVGSLTFIREAVKKGASS